MDLAEHLKKIYDLNTERNRKILLQIESINSILSDEGIFPLYLKGSGQIIDGLYNNAGERILHDIDFLVKDEHFLKTAEILQESGYHADITYRPLENIKHYPALYSDDSPAFVEIHKRHVNRKFIKCFPVESVFRDKIKPPGKDCFVMSDEHKIIQNFIHSQMEDDGHYYARASLRSLYDLLLLSKRADPEILLRNLGYYRRQSSGYLDIMYKSFGIIRPPEYEHSIHFHSFRHDINLKCKICSKISYYFLKMVYSYIRKPLMAIQDKELRTDLFKKMTDRKWYGRHLGRFVKRPK